MPDFTSIIPDTYLQVSKSFVDTVIQAQCEKLFTGLIHVHYPSGENLALTFLEGAQQRLYRSNDQTMEVIPRSSWTQSLDRADASIGLLTMPLEALRVMRVALEAPISRVETKTFSTPELMTSARSWMADPSPSILHVQGRSVSKLYLIAGFSNPILEELTIANEQALLSISDASFANSLIPGEYQVTRYVSDNEMDVWQEYELRFAFSPFIRMLVTRFSEVAGRALTERLCEQLSAGLRAGGWRINISTNGLAHHHYFDSLDEAKGAYLTILQKFIMLASPAIGPRMATGFALDTLLKLNPYHRKLLQRHIFDIYGMQGATFQAGGMTS